MITLSVDPDSPFYKATEVGDVVARTDGGGDLLGTYIVVGLTDSSVALEEVSGDTD
jgi:hypothetical protein